MHLFRIAESTELNNAWIVGIIAVCALIATWLVIALSIFLVRRAGRVLRIQALQSVTDGYARRARLMCRWPPCWCTGSRPWNRSRPTGRC
jgi:hypothetical protein